MEGPFSGMPASRLSIRHGASDHPRLGRISKRPPVKIYIDTGNDGTIDDSLFVENEYVATLLTNFSAECKDRALRSAGVFKRSIMALNSWC